MDLLGTKLVMAGLILGTNLASGLGTFGLVNCARKRLKVASAVANALTGGLFFGIIFLLLQTEIAPAEAALRKKYNITFPLPIGPTLVVAGVILFMFIDATLHLLTGSHHGHSHSLTAQVENCEDGVAEVRNKPKKKTKFCKYVIFTFLMALHSLSEGIPLGYKKKSKEVYAYFWPLFLHKILEAMSVACAGLQEKPIYAITGSTIHALMTPIGTGVGYGMVNLESSFIVDFGLLALMGLSTGALLYITFVEVLAPEVENEAISAMTKTGLVAVGFVSTASIAMFITALEVE